MITRCSRRARPSGPIHVCVHRQAVSKFSAKEAIGRQIECLTGQTPQRLFDRAVGRRRYQASSRRESLSETDPMLEEAITLVVKAGEASTSMIQRQLNIPYPRAANMMDLMMTLGILGASKDGGRSREVLIRPGTDPYKKLMSKIKK